MLHQAKQSPTILVSCQKFLFLQLQSLAGYHYDQKGGGKSRENREKSEGYLHLYKSKGQHLLTNSRVLDSIVSNSNIRPTDTVLEIGPGTGNLTLKLLEASHKVVAIEVDKRMVEVLEKRVAECGFEDRLTVICDDALKTEFPRFDLVVANIPYGISSPLVAKLVFGKNLFRSATLLLQKEFARRLLANPGESDFCRLAVNVKLVAEVEYIMDVSKRDFLPNPKVDSSVIRIRRKAEIPDVDLSEWWAFTRTCFNKKNKTLGATFKQKKKLVELLRVSKFMSLSKDDVVIDCTSDLSDSDEHEDRNCNIEPFRLSSTAAAEFSCFKGKVVELLKSSGFEDKRPSNLSIDELLYLLNAFNENEIYFFHQRDGGGMMEDADWIQ